MGSIKRVSYFLSGIMMILGSMIIIGFPEEGYQVVLFILELMLLFRGIRQLLFYFCMARYMVGGINIFYQGLLTFDAGLFAINLHDVPRIYAMLYLIVYMLIDGMIDAARAYETRTQRSSYWKYQMFSGLVKIVISIVCVFHVNSAEMIAVIYGVGLLHFAISRMVTAFRRTAIVYIQ